MKKLAILLIVLMILCIGFLSGCNENNIFGNNEIEIVSHNIETKHGSYTTTTKTSFGTQDQYVWDGDYKEVIGTIKNIADRNIDKVIITVKFYDSDNELLASKIDTVNYLANGETSGFSVVFGDVDPYFNQYNHYKISVSI